MKTASKAALITFAFAIPAFLLTRVIWPDAPGGPQPIGAQLPLLILLSVFDAAAFGAGVTLLIFGYPYLGKLSAVERKKASPELASAVWLLVSWWPHSNMHRVAGDDFWFLITIDYGFHVTLMIAGAILGLGVLRRMKQETMVSMPPPPAEKK